MVYLKNYINNVADIIISTTPKLTKSTLVEEELLNLEPKYTATYLPTLTTPTINEAIKLNLLKWLNHRIKTNSYRNYNKLNLKIGLGYGDPSYLLESKTDPSFLLIGKPTKYNVKEIYNNDLMMNLLLNELYIITIIEHENVLPLIDLIVLNNQIIFLYEYCNKDLLKLTRYDSKLIQRESINFIKQLLQGLNYLHQRNIVHRDLKLENIYFIKNKLKITSFTSSSITPTESTSELIGSLSYLAPEVLEHQEGYCQFKADVWSLGIILFILIKGHFPWTLAKAKDPFFKRYHGINFFLKQGIDPYLADLLSKMLDRNPRTRLDTFALLQALDLHSF
ncbi:kinase-like protein [Neoconidiobolus thromboides FSU 785]|nr:kinase-like protein [Neoconidiobolus thromboides FSU 785]